MGVSENAIRRRAKEEGWESQRADYEREMFARVVRTHKDIVESITGKALRLIERSAKKLLTEKDNLSPREMKDVSGVLLDVDKFMRLDEGLATEIHGRMELTHEKLLQTIHDLLTVDPAVDYGIPSEEPSLTPEPPEGSPTH